MIGKRDAGARARERLGLLHSIKWLLARRTAQIGFLALFLSGPLFGFWIAKGTLAQSLTLDLLPLTDPFILLQSAAAGLQFKGFNCRVHSWPCKAVHQISLGKIAYFVLFFILPAIF